MINSTPSPDRTPRTGGIVPFSPKTQAAVPSRDGFSPAHTAVLRAALSAQPEIRSEVVERGRLLAKDPAYPSLDVIRGLAAQIVRSPDFCDESA